MLEVWSIASSIASVILAVFAIGLSVWFFRESVRYSQEGNRAAEGISDSVKKLESLFDKLYSDTFGMMRETYADMRKHVWPNADEANEKETQEALKAIDGLRDQFVTNIAEVIKRQTRSEEDIGNIKKDISARESVAITKAIEETVDAIESPMRYDDIRGVRNLLFREILNLKAQGKNKIPADELVSPLSGRYKLRFDTIIRAMKELRSEGRIGFAEPLGPDSPVSILK